MMTLYLFVLWVLSSVIVVYFQFRYAKVNYPSSSRWKRILFSSGCLSGLLGALTFLHQEWADVRMWIVTALGGLFSGLGFTFLFPSNMQNIYPKRERPGDPDQEQ